MTANTILITSGNGGGSGIKVITHQINPNISA